MDPETKKHIEFKPESEKAHHRRKREIDEFYNQYRIARRDTESPVPFLENDTGVPEGKGLNVTVNTEGDANEDATEEGARLVCREGIEGILKFY